MKKSINNVIFNKYFKCQNPTILLKDLWNSEYENPDKVIDLFEEIPNFKKQQKEKGLKILTCKQMLQRLMQILWNANKANALTWTSR